MSLDQLSVFLWCAAGINYAILLAWFCVFVFAHDWTYRMHSRWVRMTPETFDAMNFIAVAIYKVGNILFFIVPAIALYCVRA
jgi:hypothetical protein